MDKKFKFRGGLRVDCLSGTWPGGVLEINQDYLILHDEWLGREYKFSKEEIDKIMIERFSYLLGYGIQICRNNKKYYGKIYFWYWSFYFDRLTSALSECGWRVEPEDGNISFSKIVGKSMDIIFTLFILLWLQVQFSILLQIPLLD